MDSAQFSDGRRGRKVNVVLLFACLWGLIMLSCAGRLPVSKHELKVERHLKRLNKPSIKTIQSSDGDIIDCVHISHQPAFDHPFLKDHEIQARPSYHPEGLFDEMSMRSKEITNPVTQPWHTNGKCPEDTIPIRRTKKEDVVRASSVKRYGKKKPKSIPKPESADLTNQNGEHQHAIAYVGGQPGDKYSGAKATINVWQPKVQQPNEFSLAQMWVLGFGPQLNSIEAGWQVSPELYGDNNTRLFIYWTSDAYEATGCYNLLCSGFIQVNTEIAMGASIFPLSVYDNSQYDISVLIWKDPRSGSWWMQFGDRYVMGYWPSLLFSNLADASCIQWGGEIVNSNLDGQHTSTQMGSGGFPEEEFGKASYFKNLQIVDSSNSLKSPEGLGPFTEQRYCYDVSLYKNNGWGDYFYYGGPGKNKDCL